MAIVHKYGDHVDTDVIIPARYLASQDEKELASHCMEDIDANFTHKVKAGDIIVAGLNFGCGSSDKGIRNLLRNREKFCTNLLPQRNQYRPRNSRMPRSC